MHMQKCKNLKADAPLQLTALSVSGRFTLYPPFLPLRQLFLHLDYLRVVYSKQADDGRSLFCYLQIPPETNSHFEQISCNIRWG